jgi:septal ring factor EnvC (AmiA/AmiB activator)
MPRPKGSKNKTKTTAAGNSVNYAELIEEKIALKTQTENELAEITKSVDELKNQLKEKKAALKSIEKDIQKLEDKKTAEEAKAAEEAKKAELTSVLEGLLNSGLSTDEILEKLK